MQDNCESAGLMVQGAALLGDCVVLSSAIHRHCGAVSVAESSVGAWLIVTLSFTNN